MVLGVHAEAEIQLLDVDQVIQHLANGPSIVSRFPEKLVACRHLDEASQNIRRRTQALELGRHARPCG